MVKPVMVCDALVMVTEAVTSLAALWLVSPAWLAVSVQVPMARMVTVAPFVPPVVQIVGDAEANTTGLLEPPPVAVSVKVLFGAVW